MSWTSLPSSRALRSCRVKIVSDCKKDLNKSSISKNWTKGLHHFVLGISCCQLQVAHLVEEFTGCFKSESDQHDKNHQ